MTSRPIIHSLHIPHPAQAPKGSGHCPCGIRTLDAGGVIRLAFLGMREWVLWDQVGSLVGRVNAMGDYGLLAEWERGRMEMGDGGMVGWCVVHGGIADGGYTVVCACLRSALCRWLRELGDTFNNRLMLLTRERE
jgi:hypothetical protein